MDGCYIHTSLWMFIIRLREDHPAHILVRMVVCDDEILIILLELWRLMFNCSSIDRVSAG